MHRFFARLVPLARPGARHERLRRRRDADRTGATGNRYVETFPATEPGTLTLNGAFSYPFTVTVGGSMERGR